MIPVICTTDIESDLINEILVKAYAADTDAPENLCVLTTQDWSRYRDEACLSHKEAQKQGRVAVPRGGGPMDKKGSKTYSSRDSHVVTHRSTNLPFNCLCMAERTGCPVFS
ncbi:hypothetical protein KCU73_g8771, partial [Aureobasidium melanogenum]